MFQMLMIELIFFQDSDSSEEQQDQVSKHSLSTQDMNFLRKFRMLLPHCPLSLQILCILTRLGHQQVSTGQLPSCTFTLTFQVFKKKTTGSCNRSPVFRMHCYPKPADSEENSCLLPACLPHLLIRKSETNGDQP